jgi:hypothetical protein
VLLLSVVKDLTFNMKVLNVEGGEFLKEKPRKISSFGFAFGPVNLMPL